MDYLRTIRLKNNFVNSNLFNTIQTLFANGIIILLNLGTGIITARFLGVEGRGNQAAMIMLPQFLAYTMTLGLPASIVYNFRKYKEKSIELVTTVIIWTFMIGIVSSIIGYLLIPIFLDKYSQEVIKFAQYAIFLTPLGILSTVCTPILKIKNEYRLFNRLRYLLPACTLLILLLLILTNYNNSYTFALAYLIPGIPITLWLLKKIYNLYGFMPINFYHNTKILFSYGIRAYGIDVIGTLYRNINQMLITALFSPAFLGLYVVANSISNMLNIFQNSVVEVLFPSTAGKNKELVVNIAVRSARCSNYLTFLVAIFLILTSPLLIKFLYGEEFLDATNLLRLLLLGILLSSSNWILSQSFLSLNRPGVVTILQCIGIVVTILLFMIFVKIYGLIGAGLAILISNLLRLFATLLCYKFVLKVRIPNIIFDKKDIHFILDKIKKRSLYKE